jgi:DNA-binding transcriptional ArsR family regulator
MSKESFMMVSLKGDKAKKLAQVMSNPTCMKILEYLAGKEATETQIATDLNIPLSTVHYNMQQLAAAKLVLADEFHYSDKGREVTHYKLAKQYIIIAPDDDDPGFLDRLKKFVPVVVITIAVGAVLKTMQFFTGTAASSAALSAPMDQAAAPMAYNIAADQVAQESARMAVDASADSVGGAAPALMAKMAAPVAAPLANETLNQTAAAAATVVAEPVNYAAQEAANQAAFAAQAAPVTPWWQSPMIDYFLLGAVFVIVVLLITETIFYWRSKKKN